MGMHRFVLRPAIIVTRFVENLVGLFALLLVHLLIFFFLPHTVKFKSLDFIL